MRGRGVPHAAIMCAGRACNLLIRLNKSWHRFQSPEGGRLGLQPAGVVAATLNSRCFSPPKGAG